MASHNLNKAKKIKFDEFYTKRADIEDELKHYKEHFKNKVVFCNCDDPSISEFYQYFSAQFDRLGLKKLISTHYETEKPSYKLEIIGDINKDRKVNIQDAKETKLKQNGDFRSDESIELLKESDIVVTNPPFTLLREYIAQLFEYNKKFLIVANINSATCKEIFPLYAENKMWLGYKQGAQEFLVPDYYDNKNAYVAKDGKKYAKFGNICWLTNLDIKKRHEELDLYKKYSPEEYTKYDNYDGIEVGSVANIPMDYEGNMGVPVSFLYKYNPEQFEIVGADFDLAGAVIIDGKHKPKPQRFYIESNRKYARIIIRHKKVKK